MVRLRKLVLERLMRYYRFVSESAARDQLQTVTSAQIAEVLDLDATQVRKDFGAIGLLGIGRVGFEVCEVCRAIRVTAGFDQKYQAVLIGAGHLGVALLSYSGFATYGLQILAAFDNSEALLGTEVAGYTIKPMKALTPFINRHKIRLAILTTPVAVSQKLTDRLVAAGVKAVWNFTPTGLTTPPDVLVRNEQISTGLSEVAYHLRH